jgi:hypothetical protein
MLKEQIQNLIMQQLNQNSQNVLFKLGKLGQTNASTFVIERYGTGPNENWYDVITEEFVPVVVNNFDAVYLFDNQFERQTFLTKFSFLVKFEHQDDVLEAIDNYIKSIVGTTAVVDTNYNIFYQPEDIRFINTLVLNDIKFLEFELPMTIQAANKAKFGASVEVGLKLPADENYTDLNITTYAPARVNQTVAVQYVGTNSSGSIVQGSTWSATVEFYIRTDSYYNSQVIQSLISQLENSTSPMNSKYNLRVYNPITNQSYIKNVLVTSIAMPVQRQNVLTMTISLEEANNEVI